MVKTYIGASGSTTTTANITSYSRLGGLNAVNSTETNRQILFRSAGTLSNLYVRVTVNAIAGASTIRTRKNVANGGQSVSVGSTATGEFTDAVNTDTIAAGDKLNYQFVPGAATNTMSISVWSCIFNATTDTVTRTVVSHNVSLTTASTTWFVPLFGDNGTATTTETFAKTRMRKAGTLKNCCVHVTAARAKASTVKSRKNAAADGTISVSCTAGATGFFEDTTHSDTVSAAEDWNWSITTGTGVDSLVIQTIIADFVSTNGDGIAGTGTFTLITYTDGTVRWMPISGIVLSTATEADTKADCRIAGDYLELTCLISQNDVTSASTLILRKNGADTTLSVSITGSATGVFSDSIHTVTLVSTDEINLQITAPSVSSAHTVSICNMIMVTHVTANQNYTVTMDTETVSLSESIARSVGFNRALSSETISASESMAIQQVLNRPLPETVSASESLARMTAANRALSTETTTISESPALARTIGKVRALGTETVSTSESIARTLAAVRALPETVASSESLARMTVANRALSTETVSTSESLTRIKGLVRALTTETITVGETLARMLAANRALSTETTVVSDSINRVRGIMRALATETVTVGETLNRMLAATRALIENTSFGETLTRIVAFTRALATENVTVTGGTLTRLLAATRTLVENTSIGETLNRLYGAVRAIATQTTTISDALDYVKTGGANAFNRTLTETVNLSESLTRVFTGNRVLVENISTSESLTRLLSAFRTLVENTTISDSLNRVFGLIRALATQTVSISESLLRTVGLTRVIIETVSLSDLLARQTASIRSLTDTTAVSEAIARIYGATRGLTDSIIISESLTKVKTVIKTLIETVNISESLARRFTGSRELIESIVVIDTLTKLKTFFEIPTMLKKLKDWLIAKYGSSGVEPTL